MAARFLAVTALTLLATVLEAGSAQAIVIGELDAFSTDLEGWAQGQSSTAAIGVSRAAAGGPGGASDPYMRIISDGSSSHGKIVAFNRSPAWTGSYTSAGVMRIGMDVNNPGATALKLRVALGTGVAPGSGTWFASTNAVNVPAGSGWTSIEFPLFAGSLTSVSGQGTYNAVLSNVVTLRLLHSNSPDDQGTPITASLGVDNIRALGVEPGDFDRNGLVNGSDLTKWKDSFGPTNGADGDNDGDSDGADFLIWQRQLGPAASLPLASAVPEPAAGSLAGWLMPALATLRFRAARRWLNRR